MRISFEIEDSKARRIMRSLVGSRPPESNDLASLSKQYLELLHVHELQVDAGEVKRELINIDELENLLAGLAGEANTLEELNLRGVPVEMSFDGGISFEPFNLPDLERHFQAIAAAALVDTRLSRVNVKRLLPNGETTIWDWWIQPPYPARLPVVTPDGLRVEFIYRPSTLIMEGQPIDWREIGAADQ